MKESAFAAQGNPIRLAFPETRSSERAERCCAIVADERLPSIGKEKWHIQIVILNKLHNVSVDASLKKLLAFLRV
jgi:hypothetical protein